MPTSHTALPNVLTREDVLRIIAEGPAKGQYRVVVTNFAESGELYITVSDLPQFATTSTSAIKQSLNNNLPPKLAADKVPATWPKMQVATQVIGTGEEKIEKVLLVNLDALAASEASDES